MSVYPAASQTSLAATSAATRLGTTVTGGAANTKGTYVDLLTLSAQAEGLCVRVRDAGVAATDNGSFLDVAYDDDGAGTNEVVVAPNLNTGAAGATIGGVPVTHGKTFFIPTRIPTGKHIKARIAGAQASQASQVAVWALQSVEHMENVGAITTYGAVTASSRGTTTPEGTDAYGAWTEIGTTSADHELFRVGYDQHADTTILTTDVLVKIGYGASAPGSGGTEVAFVWAFSQSNAEVIAGPFPDLWVYAAVASGTKLWAAIASAGVENRGIVIYAASGDAVAGGGSTVVINRDNDMDIRQAGSTDQSVLIHMVTTADGTPDTGVAHTDITQLHYVRQNAAPVSFAAANLAAIDSAHSDGGWEQYEATDAPGDYRLDLPDAALAAGVPRVKLVVQTATSRGELTIDLTADNPRAAAMTAAEVQAEVEDGVEAVVGAAGASLAAVPWNADWDAQVQSEVQDALDATVAEPGQGAPAATASIVTKIGYLYKAWRNKKEQTATEQKLYNDDGSTVGQKATVSDDATTATVGEMGTGA